MTSILPDAARPRSEVVRTKQITHHCGLGLLFNPIWSPDGTCSATSCLVGDCALRQTEPHVPSMWWHKASWLAHQVHAETIADILSFKTSRATVCCPVATVVPTCMDGAQQGSLGL